MESVQTRQRGSLDFEGFYRQLCALQDTCPLASVKNHLVEGVLDLNGDRIRAPDWMPILNALRINKSLNFVGVRSYYQSSPASEDTKDGKIRSRIKRRPPPIRSKDFTYRLGVAVKETLSVSQALTHLELQGIPLRNRDVQLIAKGILKNTSLQHVSLESCRIGDRGVETLCHQGIKNSPRIASLNFTSCGLTSRGAEALAKLVKHQSTQRHSEAWKDSLRYRRPDLDRMAGIRRITLNHNPLVNDDGALAFADALKDDLWLKALDMQHCGLSNLGAKAFLDSLHQNSTVVVLDIRKNDLIDRDLLKAVLKQVMINAGGEENEYKWLRPNRTQEHTSKPRKRTKTLNRSFGRKTTIRVGTLAFSSEPPRSSRATVYATRTNHHRTDVVVPAVTKPGPGFVPWRTAARACQRRILPEGPEVDSSPASTPTKPTGSVYIHTTSTTSSGELETSSKDTGTPVTAVSVTMGADSDENVVDKRMRRQMQVELEELHRRLYIESRARAAADAHIVELEVANSRLRHQLQLLEARRLPSSPLRAATSSPSDAAVNSIEDETILDSIEESFAKFHGFLDLLKEAGLGQLCTLVGMSPGEIRNPHVRSILRKHQPDPVQTAHPADTGTPGIKDTQGYHRNHTEGLPTETKAPDVTQDSALTDASDRQVYVHAPLVSQQELNGLEQSESSSKMLPVSESRLKDTRPKPVIVHPSLSEPPVPQRLTHLADHAMDDKQKKVQKVDVDATKHVQTDFDKDLEKPHIEFTRPAFGSSGDATTQKSRKENVGPTEAEDPGSPTPHAEQDSDKLKDGQQQNDATKTCQFDSDKLGDHQQQDSDKEPSSHKSVSSHSHSHRTSTPSRVSPPGLDDPAPATYSIDEDHESFGSSVSEHLDKSSEDLFADLPSPVQAIKNGGTGRNIDRGFGGDEFSSDEDF